MSSESLRYCYVVVAMQRFLVNSVLQLTAGWVNSIQEALSLESCCSSVSLRFSLVKFSQSSFLLVRQVGLCVSACAVYSCLGVSVAWPIEPLCGVLGLRRTVFRLT